MTEERRIQLTAEVDVTRTREGFAEIGQQAGQAAATVTRASEQAERAVSGIGNGADGAARKVDAAQRSLIQSIQRTTAQMEAGSRSGAAYFEVLARQRGVDPSVLAPYLAQLRAVEQTQARATEAVTQGQAAQQAAAQRAAESARAEAAAQRELAQAQAGREAFLSGLREQIALYGRSSDEVLRYRAAQAGVADAADPLIAQLRSLRAAHEQAAEAARIEAQAEREAAQAQSARNSLLASLREQIALYGRSSEEVARYRAAQAGVADAAEPLIAQLQGLRAAHDQAAEAARLEAQAEREAAQAQAARSAMLANLQEQIALYGRSSEEVMRYRAAQLGASEAAEPLIAQLQAMRAAQEQLAAATRAEAQAEREARQAQAGRDSFLSGLEQQVNAIGRTRAELLELQAAQLGVSTQAAPMIARLREAEGGLSRTGISAAQTANAMRMVPAQLNDIAISLAGGQSPLTVLMQQGSQLRDQFGSIGGAARGVASSLLGLVNPYTVAAVAAGALAVAYAQGSKEADAYRKAIIMSGNAAGESVAMMADAARDISKIVGTQGQAAEAVAALAGTNRVSADSMRKFGQVAIEVQRSLGRSVQDTVSDFAELGKSPVQASQRLNEQYRYLTASVMAQIKALDDQGRTEEAAEVAQTAYANAFSTRATKMQESLGTIERGWRSVKDVASAAWDAFLGVGRAKTPQQELDEIEKAIARAKKPFDPSVGGNAEDRANLKKNLARKVELQFVIDKDKWNAAQDAISKQLDAAAQKWDQQGDQFLSREQQRDKAIAKARTEGLAAGVSDEAINKRVAAIEKSYADLFNATVDSQIEALERKNRVQDILTQRELARIAALRSAGSMTEADSINKSADAEIEQIKRRRDALEEEIALIKRKANSIKDQQAKQGEINAIDEEIAKRQEQRTYDLAAAERKRWEQSNQLYIAGITSAQAEEQSLRDQTKAQVESNEQIGLNKVQLAQLQAARVEHIASLKEESAAALEAIEPGNKLAESYRAQAAEMRKRADAAVEGADKEFRYDQFKQAVDQYGQVFQTGFADMLNHGRDGWRSFTQSLVTTFKTTVADTIYKMFAKPFVVQMVGSFLGVSQQAIAGEIANGSSAFGGSTGTGSKDPITAAQAASNLYSMFKAGGSFETSITKGVQGMFDKLGLSQSGGAPGELATWAGRAGGTVGGYMIGSSLNSAISGQYQTGSGFMTAEKVGTAIASYFGGPIGGAIAGAVSGLINRAFGMGPTEVKSTGIMGWLNGTGAGGQSYQQLHQDGGLFRSDKNWTNPTNFDAATTSQLSQAFLAIRASAQQAAQTLGVSSAAIDQFATTFDIKLTGDAAANEKAITDFFSGISDQLAKMAMPNLDEFSKSGETASATLNRLIGDFKATDLMAQMLGKTAVDVFGSVGIESTKARERLIELAGGADILNQQAASYAQNFLTDAQRLEPVQKALDAAMSSLGLSSVTTREQFKACIDSLDLTTEAGAQQFASMMKLADAFAQVHPAIEAIVTTARSAADVLSERNGLLDQLAQLTMSKEDYDRSKLDPSNFDVYGQVQAAQAAKDAIDKAKVSADALAQVNKSFQDQIDTVLKGRMSEVEVRALETAGMDASTVALYDRLAALKAEDVATAAAAQAQQDAAAAWQQRLTDIQAANQKAESDRVAAAQAASQTLQAIANQRASMELELYNLTNSAADQLAHKRELELAALDPTLIALQKQIYAMQDQAAAADAAAQQLQAAAAAAAAVASQRAGLERELYQAQGDTAKLRELELAALDPANRALKQQIFDLQDKAVADQAAAAAAKAFGDAQVQAVLNSQKAAADLKAAWQGITDSIFDEVARIRGLSSDGGALSLSDAQTKFAIATAQARAGDQDAAKLLPTLSKTLLDLAAQNAVSMVELRRIQSFTAVSLQQTGAGLGAGLGLNVPIQPVNNSALMARLASPADNNASLVAAVERLTAENSEMRKDLNAALYAIARNTLNTADHLDDALNGEKPITTKALA
jgi:phage-related minor tail protein